MCTRRSCLHRIRTAEQSGNDAYGNDAIWVANLQLSFQGKTISHNNEAAKYNFLLQTCNTFVENIQDLRKSRQSLVYCEINISGTNAHSFRYRLCIFITLPY